MLDVFFIRAMLCAIGIAIMAGPMGCFVIWQRLSYFGDTISHSALLGVALALLLNLNVTISVFVIAIIISALLLFMQNDEKISHDSILGILAHSSLAIGLLIISSMQDVHVDLMSYLFGDILACNKKDVMTIWIACIVIIAIVSFIWNDLLFICVKKDLAMAEKKSARFAMPIFMLLLAMMIAVAMKLVGALLITSLIIIPAVTAQRFAPSPEIMAVSAAVIGGLGSVLGLLSSYYFDTRSGASIVVALFLMFIISRIFYKMKQRIEGSVTKIGSS